MAETKPDATTAATTEQDSTGTGVTAQAANAASAVKENVFSMFGGGPKKEKKEESNEGADEPSGSSKKKTGDEEVSGRWRRCSRGRSDTGWGHARWRSCS